MLSRVDGGMGSGRETCGDVAAGSGYLVSKAASCGESWRQAAP